MTADNSGGSSLFQANTFGLLRDSSCSDVGGSSMPLTSKKAAVSSVDSMASSSPFTTVYSVVSSCIMYLVSIFICISAISNNACAAAILPPYAPIYLAYPDGVIFPAIKYSVFEIYHVSPRYSIVVKYPNVLP